MSETLNVSPFLGCLWPKLPVLAPQIISRQIPSSLSQPRKFLCFPGKISVFSVRIGAVDARKQEGCLQELDDSPVSVELLRICSESQFYWVMAESQQLEESVVLVWGCLPPGKIIGSLKELGKTLHEFCRMAGWCRKCIYLKPKLEKLAAEYHPRLRFYCVDVNSVPYKLVSHAGVTKMPTIQLWRDGKKQDEVIGSHKAHIVINEVREMIENVSTS